MPNQRLLEIYVEVGHMDYEGKVPDLTDQGLKRIVEGEVRAAFYTLPDGERLFLERTPQGGILPHAPINHHPNRDVPGEHTRVIYGVLPPTEQQERIVKIESALGR